MLVLALLFLTDEKGKFDELIEDKGVKILIDPKALMHVIGTKMDFVDDKLRYISSLCTLAASGVYKRGFGKQKRKVGNLITVIQAPWTRAFKFREILNYVLF